MTSNARGYTGRSFAARITYVLRDKFGVPAGFAVLGFVPHDDGDPSRTVHSLKTWPEPFEAILDGRKRFEWRKDDREFDVGDVLWLREWIPEEQVR